MPCTCPLTSPTESANDARSLRMPPPLPSGLPPFVSLFTPRLVTNTPTLTLLRLRDSDSWLLTDGIGGPGPCLF